MRTFASYNIKGGVGKTTTAVNLAYLSARAGYRTLLWDLDPQGAATFLFRVRTRVKGGHSGSARGSITGIVKGGRALEDTIKGTDFDRLDLLPADTTYRNMDLALDSMRKPTRRMTQLLRPMAADYDVVFLDCPPSMSLVSENILDAADTVLVPLIPTTLSLRTFDQLTEFVASLDRRPPRLLGFFSMVDRRKRMHREIMAQLPQQRTDIAKTVIPALSLVEQMAEHRAPLPAFAPRSAAARHYEQLWAEVLATTDGQETPG